MAGEKRTKKNRVSLQARVRELEGKLDEQRRASAASLLPQLQRCYEEGEHTGWCIKDGACACWLGDIARSGVFGAKWKHHAEVESIHLDADEVDEMVRDALTVLADPVTLDRIVECCEDEAVGNGRGMAPNERRVEHTLQLLINAGRVREAGDWGGKTLYALVEENTHAA